ncbi:MAG TPA: hypothetical protein VIV11_38340 [Kofleriaceae bacterium]
MRLIIAITLGAALGCTSSATTRPPVEELDEGLNLIDVSDPSWGMTAAYVKDGNVVYVEQRIGAMKPQVYRDTDPDEPSNEIDMRFVDKTGQTFYVQRGGDDYVDPTWNSDINATLKSPAPVDQRIADFALAREAASALAKSLPKDFAALAYHPTTFAARPVPEEDPNLIGRIEEIESKRPADEAYYDWNGGAASWWLQGDLYDKKICYVWVCVGRHSGVAMFAYNGTWSLVVNACNHGNCPGSSKLTYRCSSNSGVWRTNVSLTGEHNGGSSVAGGCRSGYSWNSGGNNHLCNDDSAYELWQIKNGSVGDGAQYNTNGNYYSFVYTGAGTGGDGSWVNYACTCSNNNSCNNDWSRPICP